MSGRPPGDNRLWEGHRLILPEMREKAVRFCGECRFLVQVQGREEVRLGCVVSIPRYGTLQRRVPEVMRVEEVLHLAGWRGLKEILARGRPEAQACGLYRPRNQGLGV
ncbi:MAG: hypothetical protein QHH02_09710 [Syntrophomonadaceae bacterium]|nr:hypothetical protein [Syntrophomonadaceae bacterium]